MAVDRTPIAKRCKALGISPMALGYTDKKETDRHKNANQRKKVSEYGLQLREKQKLKFIYGVLEKQFYHYYEMAVREEGISGQNLIRLLETRLDNVVFRSGFAITRREARQLVGHGHFTVNGKKVDIPSYRIKDGDVIALAERSKKSPKFAEINNAVVGRNIPAWLEVNREAMTSKVLRMPQRDDDLGFEIAEHLIIELYSK